VYRLALHVCGNPSDAGDVTQEVFLKLLTRIRQYREDARFTTWLYRVALNAAFDHHRARRPLLSLDELPPATSPGVAPQQRYAEEREERLEVRRALATVKETFRAPLVLRYASELSYEEIAEVLGVSKGTVASRLSRGLRDLGRALGAEREAGP
jgi:RNA polymerase sigma-70 factor (ECF subfamily)